MQLGQFSPELHELREKWFNLVETADAWEDRGPIGEGESCPIRVWNGVSDLTGVAKPGLCKGAETSFCRAAHEKLAFDLAYLLELPVQPVVLWREGAPDQYKRGRSISAWAFRQSWTWTEAEAKGLISAAQKESAGSIVSAMQAFHIWIGDVDRNSDQLRIDMESPSAAILAFFDHSHSMSYLWNSENFPTWTCPRICLSQF